ELAEIFAIQQHRERAWHACLLICTTAISSIDSTLACFKDEIEKEEAAAFKEYLHLAIANSAAVDTSPTHQKSHHTLDRQESILSVDSSVRKAQEIFSLPKAPQAVENTWAIVARKCKKKARRKLSPAGIREVIVKKLSILPALFGKIKPVHSGFALSPCSTEARETILNAGNGLLLSGAKLEAANNWIPVIIPTVPSTIRKEQGEVIGNKAETPHRTWMAYFPKAPRASFRVFDESGISRQFKKQQKLEFCKRCNGHHPTKNCSRAPLCGNCGSTNNTEDICTAATKCRNCGGPHQSNRRKRLARPTQSGVATKEQMKTYRQGGEREYQAVLRAKATEESAACTGHKNIYLTNCQVPEVDCSFDSIPASPVDVSTGDAMRL
ncbi:hypothetical protein EPUL_003472, partial [Erysiphe pulchra]